MTIEKASSKVVEVTEVNFTWKIPQFNLNSKYSKNFTIDGMKSILLLMPETNVIKSTGSSRFQEMKPSIYFEPSDGKKRNISFFIRTSKGSAGCFLEDKNVNAGYTTYSATNYRFVDEANIRRCLEKDNELMLHCAIIVKHPPHHESVDKEHKLAKEIKSLFMNADQSDFKFIVEGREFPVHKPILAARSQIFAKIFMENSDVKSFELPNVTGEVFEELLFYIYSDHIHNFNLNWMKLLAVAHCFAIPSLMTICKNEAMNSISKANAVELFFAAHEAEIIDLKELAFNIIKESFSDVGMKIPLNFIDQPEKIKKLFQLQNETNELLNPSETSEKTKINLLPDCPKPANSLRPSNSQFRHQAQRNINDEDILKRSSDLERRKPKKVHKKKTSKVEAGGSTDNEEIKKQENDDIKENQANVEGVAENKNEKSKLMEFRKFLTNLD